MYILLVTYLAGIILSLGSVSPTYCLITRDSERTNTKESHACSFRLPYRSPRLRGRFLAACQVDWRRRPDPLRDLPAHRPGLAHMVIGCDNHVYWRSGTEVPKGLNSFIWLIERVALWRGRGICHRVDATRPNSPRHSGTQTLLCHFTQDFNKFEILGVELIKEFYELFRSNFGFNYITICLGFDSGSTLFALL